MDNRRFYRRVEPFDVHGALIYSREEHEIVAELVDVSEDGVCFSMDAAYGDLMQVGDKTPFSFVSDEYGIVTDYMLIKHIDSRDGKLYVGGSCPSRTAIWDYTSWLKCQLFQTGRFILENVS